MKVRVNVFGENAGLVLGEVLGDEYKNITDWYYEYSEMENKDVVGWIIDEVVNTKNVDVQLMFITEEGDYSVAKVLSLEEYESDVKKYGGDPYVDEGGVAEKSAYTAALVIEEDEIALDVNDLQNALGRYFTDMIPTDHILMMEGDISPLSKVMTSSEAEERWGLQPGTVRASCTRGKLKNHKGVRKSGNTWIVTVSAMKDIYGEEKGNK